MITLHIQKICKKVIKKIYNMLNNKGISGKACYPGGPTTNSHKGLYRNKIRTFFILEVKINY